MPFHFPLETVLHFRRSVEHQQELRLRAANQQVARMHTLIEHIDRQIASTYAQQSQDLTTGSTAAELQFTSACRAVLTERRSAAQRESGRLEHLRDLQKKVFQQARRERETFESLRDHQRTEYERIARRRAQRQLDDLFLTRQTHQRRG